MSLASAVRRGCLARYWPLNRFPDTSMTVQWRSLAGVTTVAKLNASFRLVVQKYLLDWYKSTWHHNVMLCLFVWAQVCDVLFSKKPAAWLSTFAIKSSMCEFFQFETGQGIDDPTLIIEGFQRCVCESFSIILNSSVYVTYFISHIRVFSSSISKRSHACMCFSIDIF